MAVNVICRNLNEDRVIPRFSRYLSIGLGWTLTAYPVPNHDVYYMSGYFEWSVTKGRTGKQPLVAYFTHLEEEPPGNGKAKLFFEMAKLVDLRIVTAPMYSDMITQFGPTVQINPPVERDRFVIPKPAEIHWPQDTARAKVGLSGYTYGNGRKGERIADAVVTSPVGRSVMWSASGRGWPVKTKMYPWSDLPRFYQGLDVLVITALVEGVPMPPLEALSCGVSIVIPRGVGLLDELPDVPGIHRYQRGHGGDCIRALGEAVDGRKSVNRLVLREVTSAYTIANWCDSHAAIFEELFL